MHGSLIIDQQIPHQDQEIFAETYSDIDYETYVRDAKERALAFRVSSTKHYRIL